MGIISERHVRIAMEGALFGSVLEHGLNPDLVISATTLDSSMYSCMPFVVSMPNER